MSDNTAITPARKLTLDDLDAIIATRKEVDRAFWRALGAVRKSGAATANEIARRVGEAGMESRPTVLDRLRDAAFADLATDIKGLGEGFHRVSQAAARAAASFNAIAEKLPLTTEIASRIPGRTIHSYDLLDEVTEAHGLSLEEAHEAIHAMLQHCIDIDGEDKIILDRRPMRPELLEDNPHDVDVYYWLTISEETATTIREALAATHEA